MSDYMFENPITLEYATGEDTVFVELRVTGEPPIIEPAKVWKAPDFNAYMVNFIGKTLILHKDSYGTVWRCWRLIRPSKAILNSEPWERIDV